MAAWIDTTPGFNEPRRGASAAAAARSPLVARLVQPGLDPARRRLRTLLLRLPDVRLRLGLGLSDADVAALRAAGVADGAGPGSAPAAVAGHTAARRVTA
jgi:hypothetical protein